MNNYVRVAITTLQAEFPSYQLLNSLHIFDVSMCSKGLYADKRDVGKESNQRLASVFKLHPGQLEAEFQDHQPIARQMLYREADTNMGAWQKGADPNPSAR